jgi:hypothetical protein
LHTVGCISHSEDSIIQREDECDHCCVALAVVDTDLDCRHAHPERDREAHPRSVADKDFFDSRGALWLLWWDNRNKKKRNKSIPDTLSQGRTC